MNRVPPVERYILTGTPGAGKTSLLHRLAVFGYTTIAESATALIEAEQARGVPEPWTLPAFLDTVVTAQRLAREAATEPGVQFHDRSPICTHALATWLGLPIPDTLSTEIERIIRDQTYCWDVFFIRNLGFCEPTEVRRISYADSLEFERLHEHTYQAFGYRLIDIPAAPLTDRVTEIKTALSQLTSTRQPS